MLHETIHIKIIKITYIINIKLKTHYSGSQNAIESLSKQLFFLTTNITVEKLYF